MSSSQSSRLPREVVSAAGGATSPGRVGPRTPERVPPARPGDTAPTSRGLSRELKILKEENDRLRDALLWVNEASSEITAKLEAHGAPEEAIEYLQSVFATAIEPESSSTKSDVNSKTRFSQASDDSACFMLYREMFDPHVVARFTIDGEPVSKSRARFTKQGSKTQTYTPEKTFVAEQTVAWKFRAAAPKHIADSEYSYGVMALFFSGTRQRRDVDNMLKLILDGLNKVAWDDDSQVVEVSGRKVFESTHPEDARTEVVVYRVGAVERRLGKCERCGDYFPNYISWGSMRRYCSTACRMASINEKRTRTCRHCGKRFIGAKVAVPPKYCSKECSYEARRRVVTCTHCGQEFSKQACHVRATNFCSDDCRNIYWRERRKSAAKGTCETCGGPTSKKTYRQCRACKVKGTGLQGKPRAVG